MDNKKIESREMYNGYKLEFENVSDDKQKFYLIPPQGQGERQEITRDEFEEICNFYKKSKEDSLASAHGIIKNAKTSDSKTVFDDGKAYYSRMFENVFKENREYLIKDEENVVTYLPTKIDTLKDGKDKQDGFVIAETFDPHFGKMDGLGGQLIYFNNQMKPVEIESYKFLETTGGVLCNYVDKDGNKKYFYSSSGGEMNIVSNDQYNKLLTEDEKKKEDLQGVIDEILKEKADERV